MTLDSSTSFIFTANGGVLTSLDHSKSQVPYQFQCQGSYLEERNPFADTDTQPQRAQQYIVWLSVDERDSVNMKTLREDIHTMFQLYVEYPQRYEGWLKSL